VFLRRASEPPGPLTWSPEPLALSLTALFSLSSICSLTGCRYSALIGVDALDDDFGSDGSDSDEGDLPSLDIPDATCEPPVPVSCDTESDDPLQTIGLDCLGGTPASGAIAGPPGSSISHEGTLGPYAPREGEKFLILSTGRAAELALSQEQLGSLGCQDPSVCPTTNFGVGPSELPAPITVLPVDDVLTCVDDPSLIGMGDCSNTLFEQWSACGIGCEVWDYTELRIGLTVPETTRGLAFDFAFLSVEWPDFDDGGFNDMFVAWLESETWTGNISFDAVGNPITVNAGFTDYVADELDGFAMEGHAGTRWLTTDVGLHPGETIELVLAVFDLSDGDYDSVVLLDGFRWTCSGTPPTTLPIP